MNLEKQPAAADPERPAPGDPDGAIARVVTAPLSLRARLSQPRAPRPVQARTAIGRG